MASFLAQHRVLKLLEYYGFDAQRMLKLAPRISEIPDLNAALQFWTTTLKPETIDAHPDILVIRPSVYKETFNNLTKVFGNNDIPTLLNRSPQIMLEDWEDMEEKIDFAVMTIEARHKEIVHSSYLKYSIEHIKTRYNFLWRCGMYVKPNKKDRKRQYVIPLQVMIESPHSEILKMTGLLAEEYSTMQKLTVKEMEKERRDLAHAATLSRAQLLRRRKQYFADIPDDYDDDDEVEEDERT